MNVTLGEPAAGGAFILLTIGILVLNIIVDIAFAIGVHTHAGKRRTLFVGPGMWAFATLLGGPFVAVAYWFVHESSLASATREK